jgi:hypothetical protein
MQALLSVARFLVKSHDPATIVMGCMNFHPIIGFVVVVVVGGGVLSSFLPSGYFKQTFSDSIIIF